MNQNKTLSNTSNFHQFVSYFPNHEYGISLTRRQPWLGTYQKLYSFLALSQCNNVETFTGVFKAWEISANSQFRLHVNH